MRRSGCSSSDSSSRVPTGGAARLGGRCGLGLHSVQQPRRQPSTPGLGHSRRLVALTIPEVGEHSAQGGQRHVAVQLAEGALQGRSWLAAHTRRPLAAAALPGAGCHGACVRTYLTPMAKERAKAQNHTKMRAGRPEFALCLPFLGPLLGLVSVYPDWTSWQHGRRVIQLGGHGARPVLLAAVFLCLDSADALWREPAATRLCLCRTVKWRLCLCRPVKQLERSAWPWTCRLLAVRSSSPRTGAPLLSGCAPLS